MGRRASVSDRKDPSGRQALAARVAASAAARLATVAAGALRRALVPGALGLLLLSPPQATAGAWPREEGRRFISLSQELVRQPGGTLTGYAGFLMEQGLGGNLTVGIEAGKPTGPPGGRWQALFFLRGAIPNPSEVRAAWSLALGFHGVTGGKIGRARPVIRPALHLGRGLSLGSRHGWLALDASAALSPGDRAIWKMDATLGLRADRDRLWFVQLQANRYPGARPGLRIVPTHVRRLSRRVHLELALAFDARAPRRTALKIGSWVEF